MIPTLEQAQTLLEQYNQDAFHLRHGKIVSGVMGWFAKELAPDEVDFWKVVGLLHDLDFEKYPEQHCIKSQEIMRGKRHRRAHHPRNSQPCISGGGHPAGAHHGKGPLRDR